MVIHFFKSRSKERINFVDLIDNYFVTMNNVTISSDDQEVEILINLKEFDFSYSFLITKRSRVASIYRLNSDYVNINLLCDIPLNLPQFIIKQILKQIDEICVKFDLTIYHERLANIENFNIYETLHLLIKERANYFEKNESIVKFLLPEETLNRICSYQTNMEHIQKLLNNEVVVNPYIVMANKDTSKVELAINWRTNCPLVFPPNLTYVQVEDEENLVSLIPVDSFMKYASKFLYEIKDTLSDLKLDCLNEKGALKLKKYVKKMRKYVVSSQDFDIIKIINLIEE